MRADRLLSILMLLQTRGRMTAHDLATRLEVSERTIYRDLEALSFAGIPVYTERGPGGGIELLDGYQTRLTGLTELEVQALTLLMKAASPSFLADLGLREALDDAFLKLQAAFSSTARANAERIQQRIHLDNSGWPFAADEHTQVAVPGSPCLRTVQQAVWQERRLFLIYRDDYEGWRELHVEPYGLVAKRGAWYLVAATSIDRPLCRVFRAVDIHAAELLSEGFERPAEFDLATYWNQYCALACRVQSAPTFVSPDLVAGPEPLMATVSVWDLPSHEIGSAAELYPGEQKIVPFRGRDKEKTQRRVPRNKKKSYKKTDSPVERKKNVVFPAQSERASGARHQKKRGNSVVAPGWMRAEEEKASGMQTLPGSGQNKKNKNLLLKKKEIASLASSASRQIKKKNSFTQNPDAFQPRDIKKTCLLLQAS
jgi:predicted DNA-binding transcriptional regulator YafY